MSSADTKTESSKLRIDKWLWAARFFKTRALAADAVECGKVLVNEARVKPAKAVGVADFLAIRLGPYQFVVEVLALSDKRGPAPQAQKLYQETEESRKRREVLAVELKAQAQNETRDGRPTKKDRRDIE
ncbi:MAG TPA: RNA-binding S4 domain-containing protein, partial [Gallionella sp.]|nr:RNA-binding S4 domain-containing protein [Gallionella sp.]